LVGAPPGYVGYEEGGQLTEAVRRRPYSVILLDEIEKAHADVFNVLLQVMDDGRLTDGQGRTVDFKNTVLIMTSNVGSQYIVNIEEQAEAAGKTVEEAEEKVRELVEGTLRDTFKPEFLNRIDDIIIFHPLSTEQIEKIVDLQLKRLDKLLADRKITLEVTPEAKRLLAEEGYDPAFGARPLKRSIQRLIQNPLAMAVLEGKFGDGDVIVVRPDGKGGLEFSNEPARETVGA
jgi:ATP-dependent Clp protease ATP-binding subunit ClpB